MGRINRKTLVGATAVNPLYPDLQLDRGHWGNDERGIRNYECLEPSDEEPGLIPWYERTPGLTVLYNSVTFMNSPLMGKPVVWRTYPTQEELHAGSDRGRIVCFSFNPYYFEEPAVKGAMTLALTWLVEGRDL